MPRLTPSAIQSSDMGFRRRRPLPPNRDPISHVFDGPKSREQPGRYAGERLALLVHRGDRLVVLALHERMHGPWPIPHGEHVTVPMGYAEFSRDVLGPERSLAALTFTDIDTHPDYYGLPLGALDDDPGIRPMHWRPPHRPFRSSNWRMKTWSTFRGPLRPSCSMKL